MYCGFWRYKISEAYKYVDKKAVIRREMRIVGKIACGVVQFLIAHAPLYRYAQVAWCANRLLPKLRLSAEKILTAA